MHISSINNVYHSNYFRKAKVSRNFKGYYTYYDNILRDIDKINQRTELMSSIKQLLSGLHEEKNIAKLSGAEILFDSSIGIEAKLSKLYELYENFHSFNTIVSKDGKDIVVKNANGIEFYSPFREGTRIELEQKYDDGLALSCRYPAYSTEHEFYPYGNIRKIKETTGSGFETSTTYTFYDKNGKIRPFRTFIGELLHI